MLKITKSVFHRGKSMVYKYTFYSLRMSSVMPYALVAVAITKLRASLKIEGMPRTRPLRFPVASCHFYSLLHCLFAPSDPKHRLSELCMPGPLLGLRDKMKESHPDAYSSFKTGQQKAEVLPGSIGVAGRQACVSWVLKDAKEKDSP